MPSGWISPIPLINADSNQGWGESGGFVPTVKAPASSQPTPMQYLEAYLLNERLKKKGKRGVLGTALRVPVGVFKGALDLITRPSHAIAEGVRRGFEGEDNLFHPMDALSGAWGGLSGKKKTGFGQVLGEFGLLSGHRRLRGVVGFGLDVATDPLMLASVAAAPVTGGASLGVVAAKLSARGLTYKTVSKASTIALKGADNVDDIKWASDILHSAGPGWNARAALAETRYKNFIDEASGKVLDDAQKAINVDRLAGLSAYAERELAEELPKVFTLRYKIPFSNRTAGDRLVNGYIQFRTPIMTPRLINVADKSGILGKVPALPAISERLGAALKPGWRNDKFHSIERVGRAKAELSEKEYLGVLGNHLADFANPKSPTYLDTPAQLDALDFAESTPGIITITTDVFKKGKTSYKANGPWSAKLNTNIIDSAVMDGTLSETQGQFLKKWFDATEYLREQDALHGVFYSPARKAAAKDGQEVFYVPHMYTKQGLKIDKTLGTTIMTKPGYEYERLGPNVSSVKKLKEMFDTGVYSKEIETDPIKLLAMRMRRGAQNHADRLIEDVLASAEGIPSKIANLAAIKKQENTAADLSEKITKLHQATTVDYDAKVSAVTGVINKTFDDLVKAEKKKLSISKGVATRKLKKSSAKLEKYRYMNKMPTFSSLVNMSKTAFDEAFPKGDDVSKGIASVGGMVRKRDHAIESASTAWKKVQSGTNSQRGRVAKQQLQLLKNAYKVPARIPVMQKYSGALRTTYHNLRVSRDLIDNALTAPLKRGESWSSRFESVLKEVKSSNHDNWDMFVAEIGFDVPREYRLLPAIIKRQQASRDRLDTAFDSKLSKLTDRRDKALTRALDKLEAGRVKDLETLENLETKLQEAARRIEYHATSMPNPLARQPGYVIVNKLKDEDGIPLAVPQEIASAITRIRQAVADDQFVREFQHVWSSLIGRWKVAVTVVNPGYRIRNTVSDLWNAYVSGVPLWAMMKYGDRALEVVRGASKGDPEALKVFREAYLHSVMSGLFGGDIEQVVRTMRGGLKGQSAKTQLLKEGKPLKAYVSLATNFNRDAENWARLMHYLYRKEGQGLSAAKAASYVRTAHFDYEDLTASERWVKRNLMPFYTWTRKNIPFQLQSIIGQPGKYATFPKLVNEMQYAAGSEEKNSVAPEWLKNAYGFRIPWGENTYFLPQFGPADLAKLEHPKQALGLLSPIIKTPIELAVNRSMLTEAPIYGSELAHPRAPISGLAAALLGPISSANVGTTSRQIKGQELRGPGAHPLVGYFAAQTPWTNLLVNQMSNIRSAQRGAGKSLLSYLGGTATYSPDVEATIGGAEQEWNRAFRQFVRGLRDEEVLAEPKKRESDFDKVRRKLIQQYLAKET